MVLKFLWEDRKRTFKNMQSSRACLDLTRRLQGLAADSFNMIYRILVLNSMFATTLKSQVI